MSKASASSDVHCIGQAIAGYERVTGLALLGYQHRPDPRGPLRWSWLDGTTSTSTQAALRFVLDRVAHHAGIVPMPNGAWLGSCLTCVGSRFAGRTLSSCASTCDTDVRT